MFARTASRQARYLSRTALGHNGFNASRAITRCQDSWFSTTRRQHAQETPRKVVPGSFTKAKFSKTDVPQLAFWKEMARPPLVENLEPEECIKAAHTYIDLAVADQPGWRNNLSISHEVLHYVAVIMMSGPPGPPFSIALHIYHTLVTLNYAPSILTMTRLAYMRKMLGQPQFRAAESKFAALVQRRDDPNACALQGLILAAKLTPETDKQALEWFRIAASLGGEVPHAWDWQASCALEMGKVYLRVKNFKNAKDIFKYCAEQLDMAEGAWLYSTLLDVSDPEKYEWTNRAAISGIKEAAREMARLESLKVQGDIPKDAGKWEQKAASVLQQEWEILAGDRAIV